MPECYSYATADQSLTGTQACLVGKTSKAAGDTKGRTNEHARAHTIILLRRHPEREEIVQVLRSENHHKCVSGATSSLLLLKPACFLEASLLSWGQLGAMPSCECVQAMPCNQPKFASYHLRT